MGALDVGANINTSTLPQVNHILTAQHGKKIAVIENEFGEVGIDDALVMETKEEVWLCI